MWLNRDAIKINMLLRSLVAMNAYTGVPIVDGDDLDTLYYIRVNLLHIPCEMYFKVEELPNVKLCRSNLGKPSFTPYTAGGLTLVPMISVGYGS